MPRKPKPSARSAREKTKPVIESATYTTAELCARYHCSRRKLRRLTTNAGYPVGEQVGKGVIYAKTAVHEWEKKNMPSLHANPEQSEEDKRWHLMYLQRQLDKQREELDPPPPPKPKRAPRARA